MDARELTAEELTRQTAYLRRLVLALIGDESLADDVLQDTWVAVLDRPPKHQGNLRGWLATVARRLALRIRRGETRRRLRERVASRAESVESTYDSVESLEWHRRVAGAVIELGEPHRSAVVLRFHEDLTLREVARRQGVSVSTAALRVREAIQQLRVRLDRDARGDRSHWQSALVSLVGLRSGQAAATQTAVGSGALITGGVLMGAKTVFVATTVAVAAASFLAGWHLRPSAEPAARVSHPPGARSPGGSAPHIAPPGLEVAEPLEGDAATPAPTGEQTSHSASEYLERLQGSRWPDASRVIAEEISQLSPEEGYRIVESIYGQIVDERKRQQLVAVFRVPVHPYFLQVANLGVGDVSPKVTGFALGLVERLGMTRFADDVTVYEAWYARNAGKSIEAVIRDGALHFADRLRGLGPTELDQALGATHPGMLIRAQEVDPVDRAEVLRGTGMVGLLQRAASADESSDSLRRRAQWWLDAIDPEASTLGEDFRDVARDPGAFSPEVAIRAYMLVGQSGDEEAVAMLVAAFEATPRRSDWMSIAMALAKTNDARAIPHMIGMIEADGTHASVYGVGWFGLTKLTGVSYDKSHDGAWWREWWIKNKGRFPESAQAVPIPDLRPVAR